MCKIYVHTFSGKKQIIINIFEEIKEIIAIIEIIVIVLQRISFIFLKHVQKVSIISLSVIPERFWNYVREIINSSHMSVLLHTWIIDKLFRIGDSYENCSTFIITNKQIALWLQILEILTIFQFFLYYYVMWLSIPFKYHTTFHWLYWTIQPCLYLSNIDHPLPPFNPSLASHFQS